MRIETELRRVYPLEVYRRGMVQSFSDVSRQRKKMKSLNSTDK